MNKLLFPNGESLRSQSLLKSRESSNCNIKGSRGSFEYIRLSGSSTQKIELGSQVGKRMRSQTKEVPPSRRPPIPDAKKPPPPPQSRPLVNPDLIKRPIRDRVIHLLALRPYKKLEIFSILKRDGVKAKDSRNLSDTLKSVSIFKENSYHLMRHVWNDVQDDWPFYTEEERHLLKRRKPENLTPPGSSDSQSTSSVRVGCLPSASKPMKRPGYFEGADGQFVKKLRISHYKLPCAGQQVPALRHPSPAAPPQDPSPPPPRNLPQRDPSLPPNLKNGITMVPKYLVDYTTIKDVEQRRKYKEDFAANYSEYIRLHSLITEVSKKFTAFQEQLEKEEPGSEGWQRIKNQIIREYEQQNKNNRHREIKIRFYYLHEKLTHVKRLVLEYDEREF